MDLGPVPLSTAVAVRRLTPWTRPIGCRLYLHRRRSLVQAAVPSRAFVWRPTICGSRGRLFGGRQPRRRGITSPCWVGGKSEPVEDLALWPWECHPGTTWARPSQVTCCRARDELTKHSTRSPSGWKFAYSPNRFSDREAWSAAAQTTDHKQGDAAPHDCQQIARGRTRAFGGFATGVGFLASE
jgi:hypothetical protein